MTQQSHYWAYSLRKPQFRKTHVPVFIAALFTIARTWKQPRCSPTDEWIKKLWYIYTMKYCLAIKRNKFESTELWWINLQLIIQSEVSQKEKKYDILAHIYIWNLKNSTDEPICRAGVETQMQEKDLWTQCGKEKAGQIQRVALKCIHYHV